MKYDAKKGTWVRIPWPQIVERIRKMYKSLDVVDKWADHSHPKTLEMLKCDHTKQDSEHAQSFYIDGECECGWPNIVTVIVDCHNCTATFKSELYREKELCVKCEKEGTFAPGHTDLMISPERIDEVFVDESKSMGQFEEEPDRDEDSWPRST